MKPPDERVRRFAHVSWYPGNRPPYNPRSVMARRHAGREGGANASGVASCWRRAGGVSWRVLDNGGRREAVLLQASTGNYFSLNGTGIRIWELSDGRATPAEIARRLCAEFDVTAARALKDVKAVGSRLLGESLLEPLAPDGP